MQCIIHTPESDHEVEAFSLAPSRGDYVYVNGVEYVVTRCVINYGKEQPGVTEPILLDIYVELDDE